MKTIIFVAILATLALSGAVREQETLGPLHPPTVDGESTAPMPLDDPNGPMEPGTMDGPMPPMPHPEGNETHGHGDGNHTHEHHGPHHGPHGHHGNHSDGNHSHGHHGHHGHHDGPNHGPHNESQVNALREQCASVCTPMVDNLARNCEQDCDGLVKGGEHPAWCLAECGPCAECWGLPLAPQQAQPQVLSKRGRGPRRDATTMPPMDGSEMPPMDTTMPVGDMPPMPLDCDQTPMPEGCDTTMMGGDLPPMDTTMMGGDLPPMDATMMDGDLPPMDATMMDGDMPPMDATMMDATMMDGDMMPPMPEGDRPHRHGNGTHGNGTHGPHDGPNGTHGHGNGAHELPEDMERLMRLSEECASVCTPMVDNLARSCEQDCDGLVSGGEHPEWCLAECAPCAECWGLPLAREGARQGAEQLLQGQ